MEPTRVYYHGTQTWSHGYGTLYYDADHKRHYIILDDGGVLVGVRRASFDIVDN